MSLYGELSRAATPWDSSSLPGSYAYPGGPVITHFGFGVSPYALIGAAVRLNRLCDDADALAEASGEETPEVLHRRAEAWASFMQTFHAADAFRC